VSPALTPPCKRPAALASLAEPPPPGRCGSRSTGARNDAGDAAAARHWQANRCRAVAAACGGQVTAWFFDTARLLPRRQAGAGTGVFGWLAAWHVPLLLADTGITISSPEEYDLMAGLLLGLGRPPGRGQAAPAAITRRIAARHTEPPPRGRPAVRRRSGPLPPDSPPPGPPGANAAGRLP